MSSAPLHVCHVIKGLGRGGAEGLLPQLVRAGGEGFRYSVVYFLPHKGHLVGDLEAAGAAVWQLPASSNVALFTRVPQLARRLCRAGVDLVHAHLPLAGVAGRLAARLAGRPLVYTEHNLLDRYHPLSRLADLATWRLQSAVVAVSGEVARSIARHAGTNVPVEVVQNGIEVPPLSDREMGRRQRVGLGLPLDAPVVATVAVFRQQKRLDLWLQVADRVAAQRPDVHFLLVGDGPLRGELERLAEHTRLGSRLHFAGLQPDVRPFLAAADVFLSTSRYEGLPLALLEAMAARLPVVVTAVGGVPEAVSDGVEGRLLDFGDLDAAVDAVLEVLSCPNLAAAWGSAGRRRVEEEFSIRRMAGELEDLYRRVLTGELT